MKRIAADSGRGGVIADRGVLEVLLSSGVPTDFRVCGPAPDAKLDAIHRSADGAEIYFCEPAQSLERAQAPSASRVARRALESRHGRARFAARYGNATVAHAALEFAPAARVRGVPRSRVAHRPRAENRRAVRAARGSPGAWTVRSNPRWGGQGRSSFPRS